MATQTIQFETLSPRQIGSGGGGVLGDGANGGSGVFVVRYLLSDLGGGSTANFLTLLGVGGG